MLDYSCYIKTHGKFQTEIKVRYPVLKEKNRYSLELYIFSPQVLSVNQKNYGISAFLKDLRVMTRISTPEIVIPRLIDEDCRESPIYRIKAELRELTSGQRGNKKILYELRTLASILRVQMRKNRLFLKKKVEKEEDIELLSGWLLDLVKNIEDFLSSFRQLKQLFISPEIDDHLNLAFDWTDESISLNIQREIGSILRICDRKPETAGCRLKLIEIIDGEISHRSDKGYLTGVKAPEKNSHGEMMIYRESILKKWSQSAMYLNVTKSRTPARVGQIVAGAAAAAAMTFAVLATILTNHFFPADTAAWALTAVIAYIFKDRIKETLRSGLRIMMPGLVPDHMVILRDTSAKSRGGHTKSFVRFMSADNVSDDILKVRGRERKPFQDMLPSENVIRYRHEVVLNGKKFYKNHERMESVTEIIRIELHKFIQLMDDPDQIYYYSRDGELQKKRLRRVYHMNLVTVLADKTTGKRKYYHHRVILNRNGIVRLERDRV